MILNVRSLKASMIILCGVLSSAAAEEVISTEPPLDAPVGIPLTEVGSLCEDTTALTVPTDGNPKIATGTHSKMFSFSDCSFYQQTPVPASVYQIEGTGAMLDVFLLSGPFGSASEMAVFEGCPGETGAAAGATDGSGNNGNGNSGNNGNGSGNNNNNNNNGNGNSKSVVIDPAMSSNCVAGQYYQGARWHAKAGQLYTIVVYSFMSLSASDFILQLETVETNPICGGDSAVLPIDLGTVNSTTGSLQKLGGPENSVFVTDLPQCDYQSQSASVLYKVTVGEPDVSVSVIVEGGDSYVTVYQGSCASNYTCTAPMNNGYGYPPMYAEDSVNAAGEVVYGDAGLVTDPTQVPTEVPGGDYLSMPRSSNNVLTFHNEEAGSTYLISVYSCCSADVSDFRLTVNTTGYGDFCEDSAEADLSSGEFSTAIDLSKGKVYKDLFACHSEVYYEETYTVSAPDQQTSSISSSSVAVTGPINSPAMIYKITGDGNTYVAYAVHANPNVYIGQVRLALFNVGSCDETPQCLQGDNYNSYLAIDTVAGETYYLAVYNDYPENRESFNLKLSPVSSKTPCADATDLGTVGSAGRTVNGTMVAAAFYRELNFCNFYSAFSRARVFSFVSEVDGPMMATVKADQSNFYPQVTVLTDCDTIDCLTGASSYEIEPMVPASVWNAKSGVTYHVLIGNSYDWYSTGNFQVDVKPLDTAQICENESAVDLGTIPDEGAMFEGSTVSAPLYSLPTSCNQEYGYSSVVTRAATFTLTGDGSAYMFSVSEAYNFSPQATVVMGGCDNLECLPTNAYTGSFLVGTELGETYTILIGDCCSAGGSGGTFNLHAKKVVAGNVTADATEMIESVGNETKLVVGSTSAGLFYPGSPICNAPVDSPATVYKLDTGAGFFTARVSGFGFEAQLSLFQADGSGGIECYGRHDYRQVTWEGKEGQNLYLVVHGCCDMNAVGDFAVRFSKSSNSGDPCNDVKALGNVTEDGLMHVGSLNGWSYLSSGNGTDGNETICEYEGHYVVSGARSKVFSVVGNGKSLVASTFISQSTMNQLVDVSVTVVKGACGSVECIEGARSESYSPRSLTWPSVAGETYDIVVSTCCSESDDEFVLMVYEDGTKMFGYGYPVYPLEGDASSTSVPTPSPGRRVRALQANSGVGAIRGISLLAGFAMILAFYF
ncbi:hypothetical protein FisN_19Hh061 [Fistulifera solaris]|uniref:Uncharacterized protein n=1 Tax=Fistulifera solaris TaxID=1519565 RepID=A0A1Z5K081_FISSO|nr:hypothetical protein FisN_19Hh061 [Fistulifera solaris]|eukprot:GAX19486.1 hypothetical protein FisN_19Hh061 [Fistulifera solaris]